MNSHNEEILANLHSPCNFNIEFFLITEHIFQFLQYHLRGRHVGNSDRVFLAAEFRKVEIFVEEIIVGEVE